MTSPYFGLWIDANLALDNAISSGKVKDYFDNLKPEGVKEIEGLQLLTDPKSRESFLRDIIKRRLTEYSRSLYEFIHKIGANFIPEFTDEEKEFLIKEFDEGEVRKRMEASSRPSESDVGTFGVFGM
jgi:hypothetical protein